MRWVSNAALPPDICPLGGPAGIVFGEADPPLVRATRLTEPWLQLITRLRRGYGVAG